MITFACPKCGMAYREPEAGAGRKFFCTNPSCGQKIQVPMPQEQFTAAGIPMEPSRRMTSKSGEWFYEQDSTEQGPITLNDLKHLAKTGNLLPSTRVWTKGMSDWQAAEKATPQLFAKPKKVIVEETVEIGGERSSFGLESIGYLVFALVAAGILAVLGYVFYPKIRGKSEETKQEQANQTPAAAFRDWSEIHKKCEPAVAYLQCSDGASGSGFLIRPGLLVTNYHVIAGDVIENITITFPADETEKAHKGVLVFEDRKRDLAIIRIRTSREPLKLASSEPTEGKPLATIGSPGTLAKGGKSKNSIRDGILNKVVQLPDGQNYYETSVTLNEGNSGGPILNSAGEAIGVAQSRGQLGRNLYYAIPLLDLRHAIEKAEAVKTVDVAAVGGEHDCVFACNYLFCLLAINEKAYNAHQKQESAKRDRWRAFGAEVAKDRQRVLNAVEKNARLPLEQKQMVRDLSRMVDDIESAYSRVVGGDAASHNLYGNLNRAAGGKIQSFRSRFSPESLMHFVEFVKLLGSLEERWSSRTGP